MIRLILLPFIFPLMALAQASVEATVDATCGGISGQAKTDIEKWCLERMKRDYQLVECELADSQPARPCEWTGASVTCRLRTTNCIPVPRGPNSTILPCPKGYENVASPEPNKPFKGKAIVNGTCKKIPEENSDKKERKEDLVS